MIAIIDYDAGNLRSVAKALERAGEKPLITCDAQTILNSQAVVLPGVGAFSDCMNSLVSKGMDKVVKACFEMKKPFLGICLGYQMLFEYSFEHAQGTNGIPGLGIFKGSVKRFPESAELKVPHMGWNTLKFAKASPFFEGLDTETYVYFVHSYYVDAEDRSLVAATCDYGITFDAAIAGDHFLAMQFHPEKSGDVGFKLLSNFLKVVKGS
jgi:glutamine amidotransferase